MTLVTTQKPLTAIGLVLALLAATLALIVGTATPARAATFTVTKTTDTADGSCSATDCSLREAIIASNNSAGADTINVPAGTYTLTRQGAGEDASSTGDLDILGSLTINGAGSATTTITANGLGDRVFDIMGKNNERTYTLTGLAVIEGSAPASGTDPGFGGGIWHRGGSGATLTLNNMIVNANTANSQGGGIYNTGGALTITGTKINSNTAKDAGGIRFENGTLMMTASAVRLNKAEDTPTKNPDGGGIQIISGTVELTNVTVSGNTAGREGGGIWVTGNTTTLKLTNATITLNSAGSGGGIRRAGGGGTPPTVTLGGTILAGNTSTTSNPISPDCLAQSGIVSSGHNLIGIDRLCTFTSSTGDLRGTEAAPINPMLGPAAANGSTGPFTHALLPGSPAIDHIPPTNCTTFLGATPTDQRGITRPQSTNCDIGAFEVERPEHDVGLVEGGIWNLRDHKNGAVRTITFGTPTDVPIMGDWNCDGVETPGLFRAQKDPADPTLPEGLAYYRNDNAAGVQVGEFRFVLGNPGDIPLAGDFNGDGCDSLSVYRPSEQKFYIADKLPPPIPLNQPLQAFNANKTYVFGVAGDKPFVGDFNGDGTETIGLHRESTGLIYYLNSHPTGSPPADVQYTFGDPGDRLVAGDWVILDGKFSPALFRSSAATFFFRDDNAVSFKPAAASFPFGTVGSAAIPVSGVMGLS